VDANKVAIPEGSREALTLEKILGIEPPEQKVAMIQPPFITEAYRRGNLDMRGYHRDAILRYSTPASKKPSTLPIPETPAINMTPAATAPKLELPPE
jgi:hypothetical protein